MFWIVKTEHRPSLRFIATGATTLAPAMQVPVVSLAREAAHSVREWAAIGRSALMTAEYAPFGRLVKSCRRTVVVSPGPIVAGSDIGSASDCG